jgi:hypothetical protein
MTTTKKMLQAAAGVGGGIDIADAFSTDLYTGTGAAQTITNGIDLSGEGGLVWIKDRNSGAKGHALFDTERGVNRKLQSQSTTNGGLIANQLTAFNANGFDIGTSGDINSSGTTFASWTFRKAPKFFDVVTYTGTGSATTVAQDLGQEVGVLIVKRTDTIGGWAVYHRANTAAPETDHLSLNLNNATADDATYWNDTAPTDSVFTVGTNAAVNASGGTYVAYIFAHDDAASGVIQCGSYTGNGSATGPVITLGWEPQWLMVKRTNTTDNWIMYDNQRSPANPLNDGLFPNLSSAEFTTAAIDVDFNATGFQLKGAGGLINGSGQTYIYMAIRAEE